MLEQFVKLVYPVTGIDRPFDVGVACASFVDIVDSFGPFVFTNSVQIHANKEYGLWLESHPNQCRKLSSPPVKRFVLPLVTFVG